MRGLRELGGATHTGWLLAGASWRDTVLLSFVELLLKDRLAVGLNDDLAAMPSLVPCRRDDGNAGTLNSGCDIRFRGR